MTTDSTTGHIFVLDRATRRVYRYDGSQWHTTDIELPVVFATPIGLDIDPFDGSLVTNSIGAFDHRYRYRNQRWYSEVPIPTMFGGPSGIAVHPQDRQVFISATNSRSIYRLSLIHI